MMRTILVSLILLLFHVTSFSLHSQAQDAGTRQTSCRDFVQSFYDWYITQNNWIRTLKDKPSAFSPELFHALQGNLKAQAKSTDDPAALEFDPFLNSQDAADHYVVGLVKLKGEDACWAEIHEVWSGKKGEEAVVAAELLNNLGQWHFANFYYRFPNSDLSTSVSSGGLLTILRNLREAQQKAGEAKSSAITHEVSHALIGKKITVHGKFSLRAKVGPYVVLDNQQVVYLVSRGSFTWGKPYSEMEGKLVAATGTLRFYRAPPAEPTDLPAARLPDYFYFEAETAQLRLVSP